MTLPTTMAGETEPTSVTGVTIGDAGAQVDPAILAEAFGAALPVLPSTAIRRPSPELWKTRLSTPSVQ